MQPQARCRALESSDVCVNSIWDFKIQSELLTIGGSLCAKAREEEEEDILRKETRQKGSALFVTGLPSRNLLGRSKASSRRSILRLNVLNTENRSVKNSRNFPINEMSRLFIPIRESIWIFNFDYFLTLSTIYFIYSLSLTENVRDFIFTPFWYFVLIISFQ